MIKSIFLKIAQLTLITVLVYAGSFVLMEERSEKTEKTEKSEETLHSFDRSNAYRLTLGHRIKKNHKVLKKEFQSTINQNRHTLISDFNVTFIYTTSFLDANI